jgi:transcription-repair coupling factor (superfamily II helicase)
LALCPDPRLWVRAAVTYAVSTATSLTVRSILNAALARAGLDAPARTFTGLVPPAKALAVASSAHRLPGATLYVVPTEAELEQATSDVRFFLGALEGLSDAMADAVVLPLPAHQVDPYRGLAPHLRTTSARARALHALATSSARVIVASAQALLPRVPTPDQLLGSSFEVRPGVDMDPQVLALLLADGGYERQDPVDQHGEFCLRGGILDIFPAGELMPVRIEFLGDTVESIRRFDPATQRSIETIDQYRVIPVRERADAESAANDSILSYLRASRGFHVVVAEPDDVKKEIEQWTAQVEASYSERVEQGQANVPTPASLILRVDEVSPILERAVTLEELGIDSGTPEGVPYDSTQASPVHVACQPTQEFHGRVADWIGDVRQARDRGDTVLFIASTHGRAERTTELLRDYEIRALSASESADLSAGAVIVAEGLITHGFRLPAAALQIYAETDVFEDERRRTSTSRKRSLAATFLSDLRDLKVGDLIVHVDHGIGQFVGLKQISIGHGDVVQEFLELRYHGEDKLFVPVERLDLVQKYTGGTKPALDRLGGTTWEKAKTKVKKAMRDMAEELLKLYAARRAMPGHAFSPDSHWQEEFEDAFEWDLTPDQVTAVTDIKRDMQSSTPMDRLLCGDVGYGKTEVAMRAAFKAVMDGKQVAVLAPTTVLAFQHLETLRRRFAAFPVKVDMVSRFRTKQEIKEALDAVAAGRLDVIVGTHRLLSKDVAFRDLGLLVVDEEQRFGVAHKERIKQMRKKVDVLTLTATPIPRTLNMSLVGIRDMSVIETPPKDRLAIQTNVVKFDAAVITRALRQELARGGQVYFVHNRVESIYSMANLLQRLVPEARVVIGHGQMSEDALERAMHDFVAHKYDVLLCTTIVENGLDIPNANTIIINRADRYGLSQLYQLRGRVGRSDRPAYAYLMVPPEASLSAVARKRLAAIKEFSDLGSGFRVAALDLEIRGAGNLLGGEQSGQIDAVGFEMYMKLLEETIRELKGEDLEDDVRATVNLKVDFRIEESYVSDMNQRLMVYRRIAAARSEEDLERVVAEVRDRYGPPPTPVLNLADYGRIRVLADGLGVETVDRDGGLVVFKFREKAKVDPVRLIKLVRDRDDLQLIPPASLKLDLTKTTNGAGGSGRPKRQPAWWTARATASEVSPGFSKAEILKPAAEDPRAPAGVLAKVTELLLAIGGER